jgi:hypothetical protein
MSDPKSGDAKPSSQTERSQQPAAEPRPKPTNIRITESSEDPPKGTQFTEQSRDASEGSK